MLIVVGWHQLKAPMLRPQIAQAVTHISEPLCGVGQGAHSAQALLHEVDAVVLTIGGVHVTLHPFRVLKNGGFTHTLRHKSPDNVDANNVLVGRDFLLRLTQFAAIQRILDATANVAGNTVRSECLACFL